MNYSFTFIRDQRRDKGLSQRELAALAGIDFTYLSRLENDLLNNNDPLPTVGLLQKLNEVLNNSP